MLYEVITGLPVSTSQAIVGAIIGWNLFSGSVTDTATLAKIFATWVACPVLAGIFAAIIVITSYSIHYTKLYEGDYALTRMRAMKQEHPVIGDVRGLGLLMGIELVKDRQTGQRATDLAEEVLYRALSKGLNFKLSMGNIITLAPPLNITQEQIDGALDILDACLSEATG